MMKGCLSIAAGLMLLLLASPAPLNAQDMAINGNFEFQALGPWLDFGKNVHSNLMVVFDTNNDGTATWSLERRPGKPDDNGGIQQEVLLVGGVTYQFDADVCYNSC
jgi:hypothetical protein